MIGRLRSSALIAAALALASPNSGFSADRAVRLLMVRGADLRFTHVSLGEGSSHSRMNGIAQDDQGFLWFGTADGVQRYDGYTVKTHRPEPGDANSVSSALINWLFKDRSGTLWIGADAFLERYDPLTDRFAHFSGGLGDADQIDGDIRDIYQDREGMIWAATVHGLFRVDPQTGHRTRYLPRSSDPSSLSSDRVMSTFEDHNGDFWVCTSEGVDLFDRRTERVTRHFALPVAWNAGFRVFQDHTGVLWLGFSSGGGLATLDKVTGITRYPFDKVEPDRGMLAGVNAIIEDEDGTLWLGTQGSGLLKLDRNRKAFVQYLNDPSDPESLSENNVLSLLEDREGNIWVATSGGGLNRFSRRSSPFMTYLHSPHRRDTLSSNFVLSAFQDREGDLWVGTRPGLNHIDHRDGGFTVYRDMGGVGNLSNGNVMATIEDSSGTLWFATWGGGLNRFNRKTRRFSVYRHNPAEPDSLSGDTVGCLYIDRRGALWAGTDRGVDRFDSHTEKFRSYQPGERNSGQYRAIVEDAAGAFWLASWQAGVQRLNHRTGEFTIYRHETDNPRSLSSDRVNALLISSSGTIWAGTTNGLDKFDPGTQTFTSYHPHDGLPSSSVNQILEDRHGNLWLGTSNGLSRFNPQRDTFHNYLISDGLPANAFNFFGNAFQNEDGEMFFSSVGGLVRFSPDQVIDNSYIPPVVFTDFRLFGRSVDSGENSVLKRSIVATNEITLSHGQDIFSFEFAALSYANPDRNRYRYKLEGLENHWNETDGSRRYASYTTLPPGAYVLRVQGSNNHGLWNEAGANIRIVILRPFWATTWFLTTIAGLVLALFWALRRIRLRHTANQFNIRVEERVHERTRIARELHDTLLQSLHGLMFEFQAARTMFQKRPDEALQALDGAIVGTERAITESQEAIENLRSTATAEDDLARLLKTAGESLAASPGADDDVPTFGLTVEGRQRTLAPVIRDEIYRIARELLRNAFRHSQAHRIEAEILYDADQLRLRVRDDGKGIDPQVVEKGRRQGHWGLPGVRERAQQIGATLDLWSESGAGTEIQLTVAGSVAYRERSRRSRFKLFQRTEHEHRSRPDSNPDGG